MRILSESTAEAIDSFPFVTNDNWIEAFSLSTSSMALLRSITILSASSSTVTSLGALEAITFGGSSTGLTVTTNVSLTVFPFDVPRITNCAVPSLLS